MHHRCACLAQSKQARHHPLERQTFSKVLHRSFTICEVTAMRRQDPQVCSEGKNFVNELRENLTLGVGTG
jgi:hypothetical protein